MYKLKTKTLENYGDVRYVTIDNQKWYVVGDIMQLLGFQFNYDVLETLTHYERKNIEYQNESGKILQACLVSNDAIKAISIYSEINNLQNVLDCLLNSSNPINKNSLQCIIFTNEEFGEIRTIQLNNETYFVGKDVATALGYADAFGALKKHVMDEDKLVCQIDSAGQKREATVINESGLYALIFGSKLESAKRFKHWVTSEVLPSVRKNGAYINNQENLSPEEVMANGLIAAQKIIDSKEKENTQLKNINQELEQKNTMLTQVNAELQPKADFHDAVAETYDAITVGKFAGILSNDHGLTIGQNKLFEYLRMRQYLCSAQHLWNKPSQQMITKGYMLYKESIRKGELKFTPYITGSGQIFLTKKILENSSFFEKKIPHKKIEYRLDKNGMDVRC